VAIQSSPTASGLRVRRARKEAAAFGADIVMAPELFLSGHPPEDLAPKPAFQEACRAALKALARGGAIKATCRAPPVYSPSGATSVNSGKYAR